MGRNKKSNVIEIKNNVIEIRNIRKDFDQQTVLENVSLSVRENEVVVIIGPSGSGKSTLLRCINKLEKIDDGKILIDQEDIYRKDINNNAIREQAVMVFQHFNLFANLTVKKNITLGPEKLQGLSQQESDELSETLLQRVGLLDKKDAYPENLSGGQKQRIAIARALAMKPKVILFDEPTSALDPEMVGEVLSVMKETVKGGMTAVIVTHEMNFAKEVADRIIFMDQGKIVAEIAPENLDASHENQRISSFLQKIV
ncbi:amino acid ABC transporter ATP-binding protein [Enterococcus sp. AZ109]|uniref:amino acid ABC transporter ATP-binding protein n=1 Tax=Enterococcus sp. AZ109 TaxID=2774634 RepID=UPI003F6880CF